MIPDLAITSLETITGFSKAGDFLFQLDELQNAAINNTQEKVDITGKHGRKLNSLKRNKAVTVTGTNGLLSLSLMAADAGADVTMNNDAGHLYMWWETVTVGEGNSASTTYTAVGTAGAEIAAAYIKHENGTLGATLSQNAEVAQGQFTYAPTTKILQFNNDIPVGSEVVVYYKRNIPSATIVSNNSNNYSKKCTLYIDALAEDKCNNLYRVQFVIFTADFSGNFNIEMGDNPTVHSFEAEALASGCTSDGKFWDLIIIGEAAKDA